jgi:hypothetical protein
MLSTREQDARKLVIRYLDMWSTVNDVALQAAPQFYGSTVEFHGRKISLQALLTEKRRFMQRWPERVYSYRRETMTVRCELSGVSCQVRSVFDFDASNPKLGRRSGGIGTHEVVVSFAADRPLITSENSRLLGRGSIKMR